MESGFLDVTNDSCLLLVGKKDSGIQSTCYQKEQQHSCERQFAFGFQMNPLQDGWLPELYDFRTNRFELQRTAVKLKIPTISLPKQRGL